MDDWYLHATIVRSVEGLNLDLFFKAVEARRCFLEVGSDS